MIEYIEREKVLEQLIPMAEASAKLHGGIMTAVSQIRNHPAADVRSVKHGYWKYKQKPKRGCYCSECDGFHPYEYRFCHWCGAGSVKLRSRVWVGDVAAV